MFHIFQSRLLQKFIIFFVAAVTIWIAVAPALSSNLFRTHDFVHGVRIAEMTRALRDGHFPVRWSRNLGYGYGMPLFEFYAPLPYYVGSFFYWLFQNLTFASRTLWIIPSIVSFVGMYYFVGRQYGRLAGLIAAVLFTLAPYRAVNLYLRGAISEVWAMSFFPWILLSFSELTQNATKKNWLRAVFFLTLLLLSHNLMSLFFLPFLCVYLLFCFGLLDSNKHLFLIIGKSALAIVFSILLSAFYLFPALLEKDFTQVNERILSGYFHYSQHFLYIRQFFRENWQYGGSQWGPDDQISFFLGYGQIILLVIAVMIFIKMVLSHFRGENVKRFSMLFFNRSNLLFCFGIFSLCLSLFLSLQRSEFIWDSISLLQVAQFPWRFLGLASFFIALVSGYVFFKMKQSLIRVTLFAVVVLMSWWRGLTYFQPEFYLDDVQAFYYDDEQRIQTEMSETLPDYLPLTLSNNLRPANLRVEVVGLEEERRQREILVDRTHEILVKTNFSSQRMMRFNVADFPGWTAAIDGVDVPHERMAVGLIEVAVPAGEHFISLQFRSTTVRSISDTISFMALILFGFLFVEFKTSLRTDKK